MARSVVCYNGAAFDYSGGAITSFPGAVTSVFGRTGAVVAASNEYSEAQISFTDITTNNVSTSKHGYTPKLPNDATKYLDGTGAYTVPPGTGGSGIGAILFDSTLGSDTASIDTGAAGIAAGYKVIAILAQVRTDSASAVVVPFFRLNNDSGGNYDAETIGGNSGTAAAGILNANTNAPFHAHGSGGSANYATMAELRIFNYDGTTFYKSGVLTVTNPDATAGNNWSEMWGVGYRSTTAISRAAVIAAGTEKFKTGSRLTVIGW